jgi:hypothetical protein
VPSHRQRAIDGVIGESREIFQSFFETRAAAEFAPRDPHHLAASPASKPSLPLTLGCLDARRLSPVRPAGAPACRAQVLECTMPQQIGE